MLPEDMPPPSEEPTTPPVVETAPTPPSAESSHNGHETPVADVVGNAEVSSSAPAEPAAPETAAKVEPEEKAEAEQPAAAETPPPAENKKHWYVVKVQSGREETIKESIEKRVKIEGLEEYFGEIYIPVEKVTEVRSGRRYTREKKVLPGYIMAEVEFNDRILYLFRETSGVGDFVGGKPNQPPPPMSQREVDKWRKAGKPDEPTISVVKHDFQLGDRVRVKDGTNMFAGMEGEVREIVEAKSAVRVELTIFGRPVPVELEYWQVEHV